MICKECGAQLDARDQTCPHCGAQVAAREGGVGFWDMLDGPGAQAPVVTTKPDEGPDRTPATPTEEPQKEVRSMTTTAYDRRPTLIAAALCILSLSALVLAAIVGMRANRELTKVQEEMAAEVAQLEGTISELEAHVEQLEQVVKANDSSAAALAVLSLPQRVSAPVAYEGDARDYLFAVLRTEGRAGSYTWQRQLDDGSFEDLAFDEKTGIDARYGVALSEGADLDSTYLVAAGLTEDAAGTYRCLVSNLYGDTLACDFTLELTADGDKTSEGMPRTVRLSDGQEASGADEAEAAADAASAAGDGTDADATTEDATTADGTATADGATTDAPEGEPQDLASPTGKGRVG